MSRTRFDVGRRADWWPAFSRSVAAPQDSVQPTTLLYTVSPTIATDTALLQDKLEKTLRDSITKWRPTTRLKFFTSLLKISAKIIYIPGANTSCKPKTYIHVGALIISGIFGFLKETWGFIFLSQDNRHSLCQSLKI